MTPEDWHEITLIAVLVCGSAIVASLLFVVFRFLGLFKTSRIASALLALSIVLAIIFFMITVQRGYKISSNWPRPMATELTAPLLLSQPDILGA